MFPKEVARAKAVLAVEQALLKPMVSLPLLKPRKMKIN
jgi:hypothetical protein